MSIGDEFGMCLQNACETLGITLRPDEMDKYQRFASMLRSWNLRANLTAITDEREIAIKHFVDSLTCCISGYIKSTDSVIDVGTGAGFPGVVIKLHYPATSVVLLDSVKKKTEFLEYAVDELGVAADVCWGRAEELGHFAEYREKFDVAVARAVAPLRVLAEYCLPFVRHGGLFVAMKGPQVENEIAEALHSIETLGGEILEFTRIQLPESGDGRCIIAVHKVSSTPRNYPRRPGTPKKNPL